jgi:acyl dehydratase
MLKTKNMKHILRNHDSSRLAVLILATSLIIAGAGYPGHASADTSIPIGSGYTLTASNPVISGSTITGKATLSGAASTSEQVQACLWYPNNDSWTQVSGSCKTVTQTAASTSVTTNAVATTPGTEYKTWAWAWQSGTSGSTTSGIVVAPLSLGSGATVGTGYTLTAQTPVLSGSNVIGTATLAGTAGTSEQVQACLWYLAGSAWTQINTSCNTVTQTAASTTVATVPVAVTAGTQYKIWAWGSRSGISNSTTGYSFTAPSTSVAGSSVPVGSGYTLTAYPPTMAGTSMVGTAKLSGTVSTSEQIQTCLMSFTGGTWQKINGTCNTVTKTAATTAIATVPVAITPGTQYETWTSGAQGGTSATVTSAATTASVLSATPYMGFDTYYALGGNINETTIKQLATQLQQNGLAQSGYNLIWLDWGWSSGTRDASGNLITNTTQWPSGLSGLTSYLHSLGFKAGVYTDAGASGCSNSGVGSLGHYQQDANSFAAWGFDAVKVDFCGAGQAGLVPQAQMTQFAAALAGNSSHRSMILNICVPWLPGQIGEPESQSSYYTYLWANNIAQSWRTGPDINFGGNTPQDWSYVMRNLHDNAAHPEVAGPGHWSDPDYLDFYGLTDAQARAELTMWSVSAAPLILSSGLSSLTPAQLADLKNPAVIAVDQDSLGQQGTMAFTQGSGGEVWFKRLSGNRLAVALLSTGSSNVSFQVTPAQMGLTGTYTQQDVWSNTLVRTSSAISATVGPTSAKLYIVQQ